MFVRSFLSLTISDLWTNKSIFESIFLSKDLKCESGDYLLYVILYQCLTTCHKSFPSVHLGLQRRSKLGLRDSAAGPPEQTYSIHLWFHNLHSSHLFLQKLTNVPTSLGLCWIMRYRRMWNCNYNLLERFQWQIIFLLFQL